MKNKKIIMAGALPYNAPTRIGIHHYASLFAKKKWDVFFLSAQLSPLHFIRGKDRIYSKEKLRLWIKGGEWYKNICSYSYMTILPILPFWAPSFIVKYSLKLSFPKLSRVIEKNEFGNADILWIENPLHCELPSLLRHKILIYRIADEIEGFGENSPSILEKHENAVRNANVIITTAKSLYEKYMQKNLKGKVLYIPNGVVFGNFNKNNLALPEEYEHIPPPRVLYTGHVASWFDQDLVIRCAENNKNLNFIIIGPATVDISKMASIKNIYILGSRKYADLPPYYTNANVGIIPFKINKLIESVNPIKLYEYMAAGLPVVCTNWKEIKEMSTPAKLAANADAFCHHIVSSLEVQNKTELVSFARQNSWENRFQRIMDEIEKDES